MNNSVTQVRSLRKQLEAAQADRDAMKDQAMNLQTEYDRLADEYAKREVCARNIFHT